MTMNASTQRARPRSTAPRRIGDATGTLSKRQQDQLADRQDAEKILADRDATLELVSLAVDDLVAGYRVFLRANNDGADFPEIDGLHQAMLALVGKVRGVEGR